MASLPEEKFPIMGWNEEDRVKALQGFKEKMLFCFKVEEGGEYADILLMADDDGMDLGRIQ